MVMRIRKCIIAVILFLSFWLPCWGGTMNVDQLESNFVLEPYLEFLTVADTADGDLDFLLEAPGLYHLEVLRPREVWSDVKYHWMRVKLESSRDRLLMLEVDNPIVGEVRVYSFVGQTLRDSAVTGLGTRSVGNTLHHCTPVIPIQMKAGQSLTILIRLEAVTMTMTPIRLWDKEALTDHFHELTLRMGIFDGILVGGVLIFLLSWYTFRDKLYLSYMYLVIAVLGFVSFFSGFGAYWLGSLDVLILEQYLPILSVQLLLIAAMDFMRKMVDSEMNYPRWDFWIHKFMIVLGGYSFIAVFLDPRVYHLLLSIIIILGVSALTFPILILLRHSEQLIWVVIGMILPLMAGMLYALQSLTGIQPYLVTQEHLHLSFFLNLVVIGAGLGKRLQLMQGQKTRLQQQALMHLREADRLKDHFLASTGHELRQPLRAITAVAENLLRKEKVGMPVQVRRNLRLIVNCGLRLSNLINDILDFSRIRQGRVMLRMQPVSLLHSVQMVFGIVGPLASKKELQLLHDFKPEIAVMADPDRLQQVLVNLVGNAVKFTNQGYIRITAEKIDHQIQICVEDTGMGIPKEFQETVFEMFRQVDASVARTHGGTGMGLSLARTLVEMQGGRLWLDATQGQGSRFIFTLSEAPESEIVQQTFLAEHQYYLGFLENEEEDSFEALPTKRGESRGRILVVDDEPVNVQVIVNYLVGEGYEVEAAFSGQQAISLIEKKGAPDLLLLDLMMPGFSGFDVCMQIRRNFSAPVLPILILTARSQMSDLVKVLEWGANDFLPKPFQARELLARVQVQMDLSHRHRTIRDFVPRKLLRSLGKDIHRIYEQHQDVERYMTVVTMFYTYTLDHRDIDDCWNQYAQKVQEYEGFLMNPGGQYCLAFFPTGPAAAVKCLVEWSSHCEAVDDCCPVFRASVHVGRITFGSVSLQSYNSMVIPVGPGIEVGQQLGIMGRYLNAPLVISETAWRLLPQGDVASRLIGRMDQDGLLVREILDVYGEKNAQKRLSSLTLFERGVQAWLDDPETPDMSLTEVVREDEGDWVARRLIEIHTKENLHEN